MAFAFDVLVLDIDMWYVLAKTSKAKAINGPICRCQSDSLLNRHEIRGLALIFMNFLVSFLKLFKF